MFTISKNGFISITRGDSFKAPLFINHGTVMCPTRFMIARYPDAVLYVGIMEPHQIFEEATIKQIYTSKSEINEYGDVLIKLRPEETEYLLPGKYYYEVKLDIGDGVLDTIIPKTEFFILN